MRCAQFRDALLQTYLLAQNLLERSQKLDLCCNTVDRVQSNGDAVAKEEQLMLCNEERHRLLMCVQNLAGCVEFSGVGNEKSYLAMCTNALNLLSEVQKDFHQACSTRLCLFANRCGLCVHVPLYVHVQYMYYRNAS